MSVSSVIFKLILLVYENKRGHVTQTTPPLGYNFLLLYCSVLAVIDQSVQCELLNFTCSKKLDGLQN